MVANLETLKVHRGLSKNLKLKLVNFYMINNGKKFYNPTLFLQLTHFFARLSGDDGEDTKALMKSADSALYRA